MGFQISCVAKVLEAVTKRTQQNLVCCAFAPDHFEEGLAQRQLVVRELALTALLLYHRSCLRVSKLRLARNVVSIDKQIVLVFSEAFHTADDIFLLQWHFVG